MSQISSYQQELLTTLKTPELKRMGAWEQSFFKHFPHGFITVSNGLPQKGPDSWPYLFCEVSERSTEPVGKVLEWLSERGIGLAVNPQKEAPDYVFTYGMIWNFRVRGTFLSELSSPIENASVEFLANEKILAGPPTEEYLPLYVRKVLREFFVDQGVYQPRILVLSRDRRNYDLCFSTESLGSPGESEHTGILEALSWFLPPHYSLMLVSEKGLPPFTLL